MKALLIIAVLGVAVWAIWTSVPRFSVVAPDTATGTEQTTAITPAPSDAGISLPARVVPQQPLDVTVDELVIVRGNVAGNLDGLLVVDCPARRSAASYGFMPQLGAYASAGLVEAAARWAGQVQEHNEDREFGPLEKVPTGYSREAKQSTSAEGRVVVHGYGRMKDALHVVAADTGATFDGLPLYTVNYKVRSSKTPATPSSVTWSAFPPGVDTPEQRRAYLQQLAEAKRQREGLQ